MSEKIVTLDTNPSQKNLSTKKNLLGCKNLNFKHLKQNTSILNLALF